MTGRRCSWGGRGRGRAGCWWRSDRRRTGRLKSTAVNRTKERTNDTPLRGNKSKDLKGNEGGSGLLFAAKYLSILGETSWAQPARDPVHLNRKLTATALSVQYRVTLAVAHLGWVDFGLDVPSSCPASSAKLPTGQVVK